MKTRFIIMSLFVISGLLSADFASATNVQNDVSVKASTGGNSSGGTTNNGSGETSVFIETKVDGEVVHRVEETKQSEAGEPIEIEKHVEYNGDEAATAKQGVEENPEEKQDNTESKPLIARLVEWVQSIFSWFLA